ncbi:MAG: GYD domain-containing protein [Chloroflexota bacterium]|nr:MAG: GYD domain-containing protein [Chloroflexota bacterium]
MPLYMLQAAFTCESWAALAKNPQRREEIVAAQLQELGGRLIGFYFAFGEYDTITIFEAPDNTVAAAAAVSFGAAGFLNTIKTTVLLTPDEAVEAMRKAGGAPYSGPSASS